ncbi:MAG TPA: glycoside hydrolase family 20 zincin-like fold domain-containing protein, partial [Acidobacteriaceae bacterium]|nr:glycoside hydrolase family 20 zincin-like fold domain-containing protein [Acidobacteriaceae bacterium]
MKRLARSTVMFIAGMFALAMAAIPAAAQAGSASSSAQAPLALMPLPSSITRGEGAFTVTPAGGAPSTFTYNYGQTHDARLEAAVRRSVIRLGRTCGGEVLRSTIDHPAPSTASLLINVAAPGEPVQTIDEDESYQLSVTPQGATLTAPTDLGAMHGLETLLQLATMEQGACVLPAVTIHDVPRFRWRGFMLDVSRHFEPVASVERALDGMA